MSPEWKVCTLEQAKRLVELGVVLETEKYWVNGHLCIRKETAYCTTFDDGQFSHPYNTGMNVYQAPDVAELGELLPSFIVRDNDVYNLTCVIFDDSVSIGHLNPVLPAVHVHNAKTEAQARCAALIWLIENEYLKVEDVNL